MSSRVWNNPSLSIGGNSLSDEAWQRLNICRLSQVLKGGSVLSLTELKTNFGLSSNSFLTYLQIKAKLSKLTMSGSAISSHKVLDEKLGTIAKGKGVVSKLYNLLCLSSPIGIT